MRENYLEALKWYGKAADMGNAEAKYKIGKILWEEGKRYLQESWEQGNADAGAFIKENLKGIEENNDCEYLVFKSPKPFSMSCFSSSESSASSEPVSPLSANTSVPYLAVSP